MKASLNHCCMYENFNIVQGDVRIKDHILPLIKKSDIIIPLAAYVGLHYAIRILLEHLQKQRCNLMLDNLSKNQRILMPTTNSAYGSGIGEDNYCDENSLS